MKYNNNNMDIMDKKKPFMTFYSGFKSKGVNLQFEDILLKIKTGEFRVLIEQIRSLEKSGDYEKKDVLKRKLPSFTPSATFTEGRKQENFQQYSGVVHLDFDNIPSDQIDELYKKITGIPLSFACFLSPSGKGIKVFIKVSTGADEHTDTYPQVLNFYESSLGIQADEKCKDITRLCFVSYDPDLYFNPDSDIFEFKPSFKEAMIGGIGKEKIALPIDFKACVRYTEKKEQYYDGNRHNFILLLAGNCNRAGIQEDEAIAEICANYDLPDKEIENTVRSFYRNNIGEFAMFAKSAELQTENLSEDPESDYLNLTSVLPTDIFPLLPHVLKKACLAFTDIRERDVFLTGALSIISGCLPNVSGVYADQVVHPNTYSFIVAPAASGKGALKFSKMLADKVHDNWLSESIEAEKKYKTMLDDFRSRHHFKRKNELCDIPPVQPAMKVLFIPANSSYAKIIWHLLQNDGVGIICETEADTMATVIKQEWGSYSDMLRKAFHHERISSSKKTDNEYIEIICPRLSVALSGTPSQVVGLISSSEDGLFSRFIFYSYRAEPTWRDVSPKMDNNLNQHFSSLSEQVASLFEYLTKHETIVELSPKQWNSLNTKCTEWLNKVIVFNGDEAGSIVKRLGLIIFRISMILTSIRKFENKVTSIKVKCSDQDFDIALKLTTVYLEHSIYMFNNLPRQEKLGLFKGGSNKQNFYDELPVQFKRSEAVILGKKYHLSERTVDNFLKNLLEGFLKQESFGSYIKITKIVKH